VNSALCVFYSLKDKAIFSKGKKVKEAIGKFKNDHYDNGDLVLIFY
jgi:hypothetical protein